MSIDIGNLETLARAATPGPWSIAEDGSPAVNAGGRAAHLIGPPGSDEETAANTQFIVAADPDAILALVARLREAEAREQALTAHVERLGKLWVPLSSDIASLFDQQPQNQEDGSYLVDGQSAHDFVMALNDAPATSLARRDADVAGRVLTEAHGELSSRQEWVAAHHLLQVAAEIKGAYRATVEQADTAKEDA